jgi:AraC-like DNA-binding protein/quercetin dioxygenase-like cupin family protein
MVRNAKFAEYAATPRQVVAIRNDFPLEHVLPPHHHERAQLVYGASGMMMVETRQGRWVVPPDRAVWIPGGVEHNLRMLTPVTTITIWVEPERKNRLPRACRVVEISHLMRSLLMAATEVEPEYDVRGRDGLLMSLLLHELIRLPALPLSLNFPAHKRLAQRCREFLNNPDPHDTIEDWSDALGMSRRTFTRLFKNETGLSFAAWRQQACLFAALPRLAANEPITRIAFDLGYDSPAAFTTMFKRLQGVPPSQYFARDDSLRADGASH